MNKRIRRKKVRKQLLGELTLAFSTSDDAVQWLETPQAGLENRTPRQAIADGEVERIILLLDTMIGKAKVRA